MLDVDGFRLVARKILGTATGEPLAYDGVVERVGVVPEQIPSSDEARILKISATSPA